MDAETDRITAALLFAFFRSAREAGATPLILVQPDRAVFEQRDQGRPRSYTPFLDHAEAGACAAIDLMDEFEARDASIDRVFRVYHDSPYGNQVVADRVLEEIATLGGLRSNR